MSRPVIAHILHRLYLAGAEVLAADLARRLGNPADERAPFRFVFLCLDEVGPLGEALRDEGFTVENLERRPGVDMAVARRIRDTARRENVAILHAHQYTPFFYAAISRAWPIIPSPLIRRRPRLLFTEHGRHYPDQASRKRIWSNRLLLRPTDRVTAVGRWVQKALVDNEGIADQRIEVIHNGIHPGRFKPADAAARSALRYSLGVTDGRPILLQVARFHPVKDHLTAIDAFARVVESIPEAMLLLVGDGEQKEAIVERIRRHGIWKSVRLLGVRSDVPDLINAADLFLLSSLSEGISVTLLEAMGCGVPIVATEVGGNPEVVEHGVTGLLSPRRDSEGMAENILELLGDEPRRRAMGEAGRERLLNHFDQDRMHEAYASMYRAMIES
ncbi:MAG: glycosyltransferase [Phycisphaeraceae bacterium]|nr:glycosyltransferase [Phycisphaeraceae bacterium]